MRCGCWRVMLLGVTSAVALASMVSPAKSLPATAATTSRILVARPAQTDFRTKRVGTENYQLMKITNTSGSAVRLVVTAELPDDFGFGLLQGQTCPVFPRGKLIEAGESCYAVVRFSPTEGFVGWQAEGFLLAEATDPSTNAVIDELAIPVRGKAVL
jgi:hypothetical protein